MTHALPLGPPVAWAMILAAPIVALGILEVTGLRSLWLPSLRTLIGSSQPL